VKKLLAASAAAAVALPLSAWAAPAEPAITTGQIDWQPCKRDDLTDLQCANTKVPLDHNKPAGKKITLALAMAEHTGPADSYQGVLLIDPGAAGSSGVDLMPRMMSRIVETLPADITEAYDIIGFDSRGVGSSEPAISCDPHYFDPTRPDYVPSTKKQEKQWLARSKAYAHSCAKTWGKLLRNMRTEDSARDIDLIRAALGQEQVTWLGYSYGSYRGAVYGTLFPQRVRRMVLDSVVRPSGWWYEDNLDQSVASNSLMREFFAWIAEHDDVYHLGTHRDEVELAYYDALDNVRADPAGGKVGAAELTDSMLVGRFTTRVWPFMAQYLSAYVTKGDEQALVDLYEFFGATTDENAYAVHLAVQCTDATYPKHWRTWRHDSARVHRFAPFVTWANTWYNAPCLFWGARPSADTPVNGEAVADALIFQATEDAVTPYAGAVEMRELFPTSSMVVEVGGLIHGVSMRGSACLDDKLAAYLVSGELPDRKSGNGPDATCAPRPETEPPPATQGQ
jgi:pimeloyl-ACP methyl ester carboxylesterase